MATAKARPADFTGRERERLAREAQEQQTARAAEMSMVTAAADEARATEVIDTTVNSAEPVVLDDIEVANVELNEEFEVIQVLDDIQQMTYGRETYDFERGRKYKVKKHIASHLREKGYVY